MLFVFSGVSFKCGTILDIACGDGRNVLFLAEKGFKVTID